MLEHVIPTTLRGLLLHGPRKAILCLCHVFQWINSPILDPSTFLSLLNDVLKPFVF